MSKVDTRYGPWKAPWMGWFLYLVALWMQYLVAVYLMSATRLADAQTKALERPAQPSKSEARLQTAERNSNAAWELSKGNKTTINRMKADLYTNRLPSPWEGK